MFLSCMISSTGIIFWGDLERFALFFWGGGGISLKFAKWEEKSHTKK